MPKKNAVILVLLGGTFMSFVGLYMRLINEADGFQIMFYRSLSLSLMVGIVCCLRRQTSAQQFIKSILSLAFTFYGFSMLHTTVASTLLILSATPFMSAAIGWLWIGERPSSITWIAMIFAFLGIYIMVYSGYTLGNNLGNFMALLSGFWFALMLVMARRSAKKDVLGGTFIGGVLCLFFGFMAAYTFGTGLKVLQTDLLIILVMGAFGIGIGIALVTWGAGYIPAAEVSILMLIESVLGPIWPWLFLGEAMTLSEISGGTLVLGSVTIFALYSARSKALT